MTQTYTITDLYKLPVHPAAELLPLASDEEIDGMAKDIAAYGLQHPIVVFVDNSEEPNGAEGPFQEYLLDGRSRLAAIKRISEDPERVVSALTLTTDKIRRVRAMRQAAVVGRRTSTGGWVTNVDPVRFVLSMNVHRRHLSVKERKTLIAQYPPEVTSREVARELGLSPTTVAETRRGGAANVQNGQMTHPAERAQAALRANPEASNRELAQRAKVDESTIRRSRKALGLDRPNPTPIPEPTPTPTAAAVRKRRDVKGAERALADLLEQFERAALQKAWHKLGLDT